MLCVPSCLSIDLSIDSLKLCDGRNCIPLVLHPSCIAYQIFVWRRRSGIALTAPPGAEEEKAEIQT